MNDEFNDFVVVYSAEIVRRIKSRPFQVGLVIGLLMIFVFTKLPGWLGNAFDDNRAAIVLAGSPALTTPARKALSTDFTIVQTRTSTQAPTASAVHALKASIELALARGANGLDITVYTTKTNSSATDTIVYDLRPLSVSLGAKMSASQAATLVDIHPKTVALSSKFGSSAQADAAFGVGYGLLFFLYLLILLNSQLIMSSVAEEKTSRIAELLVASISPTPLLYGKIASTATLGILQMIIWIVFAAFTGGHAAGSSSGGFDMAGVINGTLTPTVLISFFILFILGFLQLSMLFAGLGSLINRTEDLGSLSFPLVMPVVAAFMISMATLASPTASWAVVISFIPILSPFVMFARIVMSDVPLWQIALSVGINALAAWGIALLAGKLYRVGMLLYGRAPSFGQIWHVLRS
jgi:ABC-2 type transport system permease protein